MNNNIIFPALHQNIMKANYSLPSFSFLQLDVMFQLKKKVSVSYLVFVSTDDKVHTVFMKVFMIRQVFGLRLQPKGLFT